MGDDEITPVIEPLTKRHDRESFSCEDEQLNRYLQKQANQDRKRNIAAPFVLVDEGSTRILGFYTLSALGINSEELPDRITRKLPSYPQIPATLLGRLAVDESYSGQGFGKLLLMDALLRSLNQAREIAPHAVVVEAKNDAAVAFYRKYGFELFPDKPHRLYIPMGAIADLVS